MGWNGSFSPFQEFYLNDSSAAPDGLISNPKPFQVFGREPSRILLGSFGQTSFQEFVSSPLLSGSNWLWIRGENNWTQYVACPEDTGLELVAYAAEGGLAEVYQIRDQTVSSGRYNLSRGYSSMTFAAEETGRSILLFVVDNQPSSAVIVDVIAMPPETGTVTSAPDLNPEPQVSQPQQQPSYFVPAPEIPSPSYGSSGDTKVTIQSQGMRGYDVFVDEVYLGREGTGGDPLDGSFSFRVEGNQEHFIRVFDGEFNYPKQIYFRRGETKIIRVEPGTAVYI
jgi:hypothetical protein